jgi:hypothetical protein
MELLPQFPLAILKLLNLIARILQGRDGIDDDAGRLGLEAVAAFGRTTVAFDLAQAAPLARWKRQRRRNLVFGWVKRTSFTLELCLAGHLWLCWLGREMNELHY